MGTTRNQNNDDNASSSRKRPKSCSPWSDLDHDLHHLVMMQLGVVDYLSFGGVCKSWRSVAILNQNNFMASKPPMTMHFSWFTYEKACYLEDFEGRKFKTLLPWFFVVDDYVGITCGYLIFFTNATRNFWLVNPITRDLLHFPNFPNNFHPSIPKGKSILVFSPSKFGRLFVVLFKGEIGYSIEGKGSWNHVSHTLYIKDLYALKGKLYTLTYSINPFLHELNHICELRLNSEPKFTLLETNNPLCSKLLYLSTFLRSNDNLYVIGASMDSLRETDFGKMKWMSHEKIIGEYALFCSNLNDVAVAVKQESWADPRLWSHGRFADTYNYGNFRFISANIWYFPHQCMNVDRVDE